MVGVSFCQISGANGVVTLVTFVRWWWAILGKAFSKHFAYNGLSGVSGH